MSEYKIILVATDQIKFFVRRARREAAYARLKKSIQEIGLKTPIGVRDMSDRPAKERRRPGGGQYKLELVYGQGRLQAFRELGIERIPAVLVDVTEEEIVGRFLAENVMRRSLNWREKAKLIEYDYETNELSIDDIAERYCITASHAQKYLRIIKGASDKALKRADAEELDMAVTEKLTTLPKDAQDAVIDVLDAHQLDKTAIMHLVSEAARLRQRGNGKVTKDLLSESLGELNDRLRKCRELFKLKRLEYALGPQHLFRMVEQSHVFIKQLEEAGIDLSHFKQRS